MTRRALAIACLLASCAPAVMPRTDPVAASSVKPVARPVESFRLTPDAPFREKEPPAGANIEFHPPAIQSLALKNGIRVWLVERPKPSLASIRVVVSRGAADVDTRPGAIDFLMFAVRFSAAGRSRAEIFGQLSELSTEVTTPDSQDWSEFLLKGPSHALPRTVELMSTLLVKPEFNDHEVERHKSYLSAHVDQEANNAGAVARRSFALATWGPGHPYSQVPVGRPEDIRALTRAEIVRIHADHFAPATTTIVAAGDLRAPDLLPLLESSFGAWKGKAAPRKPIPEPSRELDSAPRIVVINRSGAPQSHLIYGGVGPARAASDWNAAVVLNAVYGGTNSSRLSRSLRNELGFTWSGLSMLLPRRGPSPFYWEGEVAREATAETLREIRRRAKELRELEVPPAELGEVKQRIRLGFPGEFETVEDITERIAALAIYELPMSEYETAQQRIDAVTAADVKRAAAAYLDPARTRAVIVGDWEVLKTSLKSLGWGPIELRDATGKITGRE
ncbi:MAG: insulinase family protein [Deltaproteobacteria bacterium]|nr:insulinase family protein [Deltaproteobacteria bacterium]